MRKILFYDTETSGLPKNYKASQTDTNNWPFICQLAWVVADENGNILLQKDRLISPMRDGELAYQISAEASKVNGHTVENLTEKGLQLEVVIAEIAQDILGADLIVCHNLGFDLPVLACEMIRAKVTAAKKEKFCTMAASTDVCKIQGPYGYKWPKLQELHAHLFGAQFDGAHDALADILATVRCYFAMREKYQNTPI